MLDYGRINCVNTSELPRLRAELERDGSVVFELRGDAITDKASFLRQAAIDLPHPSGLIPHNWDAFVDCLWGGIEETNALLVAVLWTEAHRMLQGGLHDLLTAVSCFEQVAHSLFSAERESIHPIQLVVFLIGDGENFPPLLADY